MGRHRAAPLRQEPRHLRPVGGGGRRGHRAPSPLAAGPAGGRAAGAPPRWEGTGLPWYHYGAPMAPIAMGGTLAGLAVAAGRDDRWSQRLERAWWFGPLLVLLLAARSPGGAGRQPRVERGRPRRRPGRGRGGGPGADDDAVSADQHVLAQLGHRERACFFPIPFGVPEDFFAEGSAPDLDQYGPNAVDVVIAPQVPEALVTSGRFEVVAESTVSWCWTAPTGKMTPSDDDDGGRRLSGWSRPGPAVASAPLWATPRAPRDAAGAAAGGRHRAPRTRPTRGPRISRPARSPPATAGSCRTPCRRWTRTATLYPLELSTVRPDGTAAYAKHPAYPWLLAQADGAGDHEAMVLMSLLGTWLAALGAAVLARQLLGGLEPPRSGSPAPGRPSSSTATG